MQKNRNKNKIYETDAFEKMSKASVFFCCVHSLKNSCTCKKIKIKPKNNIQKGIDEQPEKSTRISAQNKAQISKDSSSAEAEKVLVLYSHKEHMKDIG